MTGVRVISGPVATITIDLPARRNALGIGVLEALADAFDAADSDESTRAIVLSGQPGVFSAGGDIKEAARFDRTAAVVTRLFAAIESASQPVIAKVDGHCIGLALGLVAACDLAVATPESRFALPEARMGQAPTLAMLTLRKKLRAADLSELVLTGLSFGGEYAVELGLVTRCVPTAELDRVVEIWSSAVQESDSRAITACKKLTRMSAADDGPARALALALGSDLDRSSSM